MACPLAHLNPAFQRHDCDATLGSITENALPDGRATARPLDHPLRVEQRDRQGARALLCNRRSTAKGAHSIHKSLSAQLLTGVWGRQPILNTLVVLLVGWQLPTG